MFERKETANPASKATHYCSTLTGSHSFATLLQLATSSSSLVNIPAARSK